MSMGRVQVVQPKYGNRCLTAQAKTSAFEFLVGMGVHVSKIPECLPAEDADAWSIEIDDAGRMSSVIAYLEQHPESVTVCYDCCEVSKSADFANLLQEGLDAAKRSGYGYIVIEWW